MKIDSNKTSAIFDRYNIILILVIIAGAFLRFKGIGDENLWLDEAATVWFGSKGYDFITVIKRITTYLQGPLYYIVIHFWFYLVEVTEATVRIPSAIFGILSIFGIYRVSVYLFNKNVGIYSSALLAFSGINFYYSQEARTYTLSTLLTIISYYYFLKTLKGHSKYNILIYCATTSLLVYSHYYYLLIIFSQLIYLAVLYNKQLNRTIIFRWFRIQIFVLISLVPAIYLLSEYQIHAENISRGGFVNYLTLFQILKYLSGSSVLFLIFSILSVFSLIIHSPITENYKSHYNFPYNAFLISIDSKKLLLCTWLFIPIITAILIGIFYKTTFYNRYFIVCTPALFILVSAGINNIKFSLARKIIIVSLIFLSLIPIFKYYGDINKTEWKKIVQIVEEGYENNDLVIYYPGYLSRPFNYYSENSYFPNKLKYESKNRVLNEQLLWKHPPEIKDTLVNELSSGNYNKIWFIQSSEDKKSIKFENIFKENRNYFYKKRISRNGNIYLSLYSKVKIQNNF